MIIEAIALSSVPGQFSATSSEGTIIVAKSRMPLLEAARAIHSTGNSTFALIMRHAGSSADALRATVGYAAGLTVGSDHTGMPVFLPYKVQ
jgi:hypothetical protein